MGGLNIIDINPENVFQEKLFCIKDVKNPGFENKRRWFEERYDEGLRIKILKDETGKQIAFIEYVPLEYAWRPIEQGNYMFIHCMYVAANKEKRKGYGSMMLEACAEDAIALKMDGIAVMTSKGSWTADKRLFVNNGFLEVENRGRFELMVKKFRKEAADPKLIDWTKNQNKYKGWHLLYTDQCPWHEKSVIAIKETAEENGIDLKIKKIINAGEAKMAPSGFAVFNLLHNGKLLDDHYISQTRFKNILKKELS